MTMAASRSPDADDWTFQQDSLQRVSRTFALTIPQLPGGLREVVGNAYLLCRIADTIEDDRDLPFAEKRRFASRFIDVVGAREDTAAFAAALHPRLSVSATDAERELIRNAPAVLRITHSFRPRERAALERCVRIMADGMARFQEGNVRHGLRDLVELDDYCYHVAGVVGEMLTELFCAHDPDIDARRDELMPLAVSFGQGLQMTNILKDIWDDLGRGMCWLPRDVFARFGADLRELAPGRPPLPGFTDGIGVLIGVAHAHLDNALRYTLAIPARQRGIRRFCLWALGMAVLTLRRLDARRDFTAGAQVKIPRRAVRATVLVSNTLTGNDLLLRAAFRAVAAGLPRETLGGRHALPVPGG
jgi:farnesyl-diphosphate farnesyltransferase